MRAASTATSSCAWAIDAPEARRATTVSDRARREAPWRSFGSKASGVHTSTAVAVGNSNPGGITPTTVNGTASSWIGVPTMARSPPSTRVQKPWLTTTTRSAPTTASSGTKVRPSAALALSTVNNSGVARTPGTFIGSPEPAYEKST